MFNVSLAPHPCCRFFLQGSSLKGKHCAKNKWLNINFYLEHGFIYWRQSWFQQLLHKFLHKKDMNTKAQNRNVFSKGPIIFLAVLLFPRNVIYSEQHTCMQVVNSCPGTSADLLGLVSSVSTPKGEVIQYQNCFRFRWPEQNGGMFQWVDCGAIPFTGTKYCWITFFVLRKIGCGGCLSCFRSSYGEEVVKYHFSKKKQFLFYTSLF